MGAWIKRNPVWFMTTVEAVVVAVMNLILVFGVKLTPDQIRAIRNLVAAATPNLKPQRVALTDQTGEQAPPRQLSLLAEAG